MHSEFETLIVKQISRIFDLKPNKITRLSGGRNSKVWMFDLDNKKHILKKFNENDPKVDKKFSAELHFLEHCQKAGITSVPVVRAFDWDTRSILMTHLPGQRIKSVDSALIEQSAEFIITLNKGNLKEFIDDSHIASDACFTIEDHVRVVRSKLELFKCIDPKNRQEKEVLKWIATTLSDRLESSIDRIDCSNNEILSDGCLILSPSDFGFHNMLREGERTFFFDFEHSGLDSITKLCCDFCCQPDNRLPLSRQKYFISKLSLGFSAPRLWRTVEKLKPLHKVKWCLIMLNLLTPLGKEKSLFSEGKTAGLLEEQFVRAKSYIG